jgi:hypothetical protein
MATFLSNRNPKSLAFLAGSTFLFLYWIIGFDGITFSDDVYYLLAGKKFWEGTMEANAYHFSTRWGAYVPSGLIGWLLGFEPHRISLISLFSYLGSLALLLKVLPSKSNPWILVVWISTQVYFLHFLTKVYPDSLLVFWVVLIPFSAVYRHKKPFLAALGLVSGLFFGFLTKETIVLLGPLPFLLFYFDRRNKLVVASFYFWILAIGFLFAAMYLSYFWVKFGDPFYRITSINAGHYISEFTYADKGIWSILRRISYLPILTFVERGYWLWIILAFPALSRQWKKQTTPVLEFSIAALLLLVGFWLMTSTLEFYNPIYLNPRHLIILVPILAYLIASGWEDWREKPNMRRAILALILLGVGISIFQGDLKMAGFQAAFFLLILAQKLPFRSLLFVPILAIPALFSISYQHKLKSYPSLLITLKEEIKNSENQEVILVNNFIDFSKEVLLDGDRMAQSKLAGIEKIDSIQSLNPSRIQVMIYRYYQHAYPKEQVDVDTLEKWLTSEFVLLEEKEKDQIWVRSFERKSTQ